MRKTVTLLSYRILVHFQNGASIFIIQFEPSLSSSFRRFLSSLSAVWRRAVRVRAGFVAWCLSVCVWLLSAQGFEQPGASSYHCSSLCLCAFKRPRGLLRPTAYTHTHHLLGFTGFNQKSVLHCSYYILHIKPQRSCCYLFSVIFTWLNQESSLSKCICPDAYAENIRRPTKHFQRKRHSVPESQLPKINWTCAASIINTLIWCPSCSRSHARLHSALCRARQEALNLAQSMINRPRAQASFDFILLWLTGINTLSFVQPSTSTSPYCRVCVWGRRRENRRATAHGEMQVCYDIADAACKTLLW